MFDTSANRFRLELDWIKALPGGVETDFILVSCAGTPRPGGRTLRSTAARRRLHVAPLISAHVAAVGAEHDAQGLGQLCGSAVYTSANRSLG